MVRISVVVPTFNEEDHLPDFLRDLQNQSMQPDEVIVADAYSSDKTRVIAQQAGAIVVDGGMPGAGRNRGVEASSGDIIFFFDADVSLRDPDFLKKAVTEFEDRQLDIATVNVAPVGGNRFDIVAHKVYNFYVRMVARLFPHAPGFCMIVRRSLHEKIHGFDETVVFCEDHEYALRASREGKFGFLSRDLTVHVSTRRQDRDGRFMMSLTYILAELHIRFIGPIRHNKFNYTFGHPKK